MLIYTYQPKEVSCPKHNMQSKYVTTRWGYISGPPYQYGGPAYSLLTRDFPELPRQGNDDIQVSSRFANFRCQREHRHYEEA